MPEDFPLEAPRTALLFFDTLKGGTKARDDTAPDPAPYVQRLVKLAMAAREAGVSIFYAQPEHRRDGKDWGVTIVDDAPTDYKHPQPDHVGVPGKTFFRGLNYKGAEFAEIIPDIAPQDGDYVIAKHRWSAFFQTCLELSLRTAEIDTIILAGSATEIGIASTAYSARDHDYNLIIVSDACREWAPGMNQIWMERIFPQMARVRTTGEVVKMLQHSRHAKRQ